MQAAVLQCTQLCNDIRAHHKFEKMHAVVLQCTQRCSSMNLEVRSHLEIQFGCRLWFCHVRSSIDVDIPWYKLIYHSHIDLHLDGALIEGGIWCPAGKASR